jgi:hypothetical protein
LLVVRLVGGGIAAFCVTRMTKEKW